MRHIPTEEQRRASPWRLIWKWSGESTQLVSFLSHRIFWRVFKDISRHCQRDHVTPSIIPVKRVSEVKSTFNTKQWQYCVCPTLSYWNKCYQHCTCWTDDVLLCKTKTTTNHVYMCMFCLLLPELEDCRLQENLPPSRNELCLGDPWPCLPSGRSHRPWVHSQWTVPSSQASARGTATQTPFEFSQQRTPDNPQCLLQV